MNTDHTDYKNLVDLLSVVSEATARMLALQADVQSEYLELVDGKKPDYASLQKTISDAEASILAIVEANPKWFEDAKTVKTPYGSVTTRKTTSLEVPNEEASIILIEQIADEDEKERLLRKSTVLDLEALEKLSDAELKAFRIRRITGRSTKVVPLKIDLGKAVKQAGKEAK